MRIRLWILPITCTKTPDCLPRLSQIPAALEPETTDYYYYALGKDKLHHYSTTLQEHNNFLNSGNYIGN